MTTAAAVEHRLRAGLAALSHTGPPPPRLSRWAWAADTLLALALAVGILAGLSGQDAATAMVGPRTGLVAPVAPRIAPAAPAEPRAPGGPSAPVLPGARISNVDPAQASPTLAGRRLVLWILLGLLAALPLVARRRYPLTAFWTVILAAELYHRLPGLDATFTFAACVIAAYSAVMYSRYRLPAIASALAGAGLVVGSRASNLPDAKPVAVLLLLLVPLALAANAVYVLQQRIRAVQERQESETRLAVQRERARIAQELHDVVTHNVSVMVVQAGAARTVLASAPDKAHQALLAIESGGRAAMSELRHVMGLLSMNGDAPDPTDPDDLAPTPGLDQAAVLVDRVRASGVPVELTITGTPVPLPAGVDLAAYRVVQEALTNTVKYAAGASVSVGVEYALGEVRVQVADTGGNPSPAAGSGNGRGLIGLRERLAVYGGVLEAGARPLGGYRVRAVIPLEET